MLLPGQKSYGSNIVQKSHAGSGRKLQVTFRTTIRIKKKSYLHDFGCVMDASTKWAGLGISYTADLLGFSHTTAQQQWVTVVWVEICAIVSVGMVKYRVHVWL